MDDFIHMGGYGAYVWAAYATFTAVLIADALTPLWQRRTTLRDIAARLRRESSRGNVLRNRPGRADEGSQ